MGPEAAGQRGRRATRDEKKKQILRMSDGHCTGTAQPKRKRDEGEEQAADDDTVWERSKQLCLRDLNAARAIFDSADRRVNLHSYCPSESAHFHVQNARTLLALAECVRQRRLDIARSAGASRSEAPPHM